MGEQTPEDRNTGPYEVDKRAFEASRLIMWELIYDDLAYARHLADDVKPRLEIINAIEASQSTDVLFVDSP